MNECSLIFLVLAFFVGMGGIALPIIRLSFRLALHLTKDMFAFFSSNIGVLKIVESPEFGLTNAEAWTAQQWFRTILLWVGSAFFFSSDCFPCILLSFSQRCAQKPDIEMVSLCCSVAGSLACLNACKQL